MRGYVTIEHRGVDRDPVTGQQRKRVWWWFSTDPFVYSVWYRPDGSKTIEQFRDEQAAAAGAHMRVAA